MDQFTKDWVSMKDIDGCSSGIFKYIAKMALKRIYRCCCGDHDFDYKFGWRHGISRRQSDVYLRDCIEASGHPKIARYVYYGVRAFGWMFYNKGE